MPLRADDRGSALVFAIGVLALIAVLGAVVMANARAEIRSAERAVDRAGSESLLDVAVSAAWGDIAGGATVAFTDAGSTNGEPWSYRATPIDPDRWSIEAEAGTGVDASAAVVVVTRELLHPYTLFASSISAGPLAGQVDGRVGIADQAVFRGRSLGSVQELIGPDATCRGCRNPVVVAAAAGRADDFDVPPRRSCPADPDGLITGTLTPGTHRCLDAGPYTMDATIDITGPVTIELGPDTVLDLAAARVNEGGTAVDFVISQPSVRSGSITASGAVIHGVVLAPETTLSAGDLTWRGTIDVGTFRPANGARLDGSWDPSLAQLGHGDWTIVSWDRQPR